LPIGGRSRAATPFACGAGTLRRGFAQGSRMISRRTSGRRSCPPPSLAEQALCAWPRLARIFHSHFGKSREKPHEKRGANTCECVVEKMRHAGLETCDTAGLEACATTLECRRVSRRIVARFQRLMATVAANPGRCPGLSCGGLSGLVFAPPFWKKEAMDLPLTERLRGCDTAGWEACATRVCHGFAGFTMKYPG